MPDLETVIPVWEQMKRTIAPERDTCNLYGFQLDKRARFRDSDSCSENIKNFFLPEFIIKCIPSEGYLTYLFCVCGCCYAECYINPYEMYKLLIQQYSQKLPDKIVIFVYTGLLSYK